MKESSRLLTAVLSHFGHALKNIETVFREATEELLDSKNEDLITIGKDANIALTKLSGISHLMGLLEEGEGEKIDPYILALKSLLINSCPREGTVTTLELIGLNANNLKIELPCQEKFLLSLLSTENQNLNIPIANLLLIRLLYELIKEAHYTFFINGEKLY